MPAAVAGFATSVAAVFGVSAVATAAFISGALKFILVNVALGAMRFQDAAGDIWDVIDE